MLQSRLRSGPRIALALVALSSPVAFAAAQATPQSAPSAASLAIPAGSKVELVLRRALLAKSTKPGDPVYLQASFPTTAGKAIAIPAGTYVQAEIVSLKRPGWLSARAELHLRFTTLIFANGYTVSLDGDAAPPSGAAAPGISAQQPTGTRALITIEVARNSEVLLDTGDAIEMTLTSPLALNASQVAEAVPLSRAPDPAQFRIASLCHPVAGTPGTPGTPDTVIPGSPGTPPTTIPGGPGMPDTTIPGTPPTPPTIIPGTPGTAGTPGVSCPSPPLVLSSTPESAPAGTPPPHP